MAGAITQLLEADLVVRTVDMQDELLKPMMDCLAAIAITQKPDAGPALAAPWATDVGMRTLQLVLRTLHKSYGEGAQVCGTS